MTVPSAGRLLTGWVLGLALALAGCPESCNAPKKPAIASLEAARGEVKVVRAGVPGEVAAQVGPLFDGDLVRTGADGEARVRMTDGRLVILRPDGRFTVRAKDRGVRVELDEGEILTEPSAAGGSGGFDIELETPFGRTVIGSGANGAFGVRGGALTVSLEAGDIEVEDRAGKKAQVGAGDRFAVTLEGIEDEKEDAADAGADAGVDAADAGVEVVELTDIEVRLSRLAGKVEARDGPGAKLQILRGVKVLPSGGGFAVGKGGAGKLSSKDLAIALEANTRGTVKRAQRNGGTDEFALVLDSGSVQVAGTGTSMRRIEVSDGKVTVTATTTGEGAAEIVKVAGGLEVSVRAGAWSVVTDSGTKELASGQRAKVSAAGVEISDAPPPAVILPAGVKVRVFWSEPLELGLGWTGSEAKAKVEVSDSALFESVLAEGEVKDYLAVKGPMTGQLHWRAAGQVGAAIFAPDRSYLPGTDKSVAEVTETGLKATVYFQSNPPPIAFGGNANDKAASYRLKVFKSDTLTSPLLERTGTDPRFEVERGKLPEGNYVWNISGLDGGGREFAGGKMNALDIVYENSLTTLLISKPRPNERIRGKAAEIAGIAPLGVKLSVNDAAVPTDDKGRFKARVPNAELLVFKLIERDGDQTLHIRKVRRAK